MFPNAVFYFAVLIIVAIGAFWVPWYSDIFAERNFWTNFHAIVMSAWLLLLMTQAYLMRNGKWQSHRQMGKIAFVLGPLCILSFPLLANAMFPPGGTTVPLFRSYILWLQTGLFVLFTWFFIAAIHYRKRPAIHARFMIATAITVLDPILVRFPIFYGPDAGKVPDMTIAPVGLQYLSYPVILITLLALMYFDRKNIDARWVFRSAFLGFAIFMILTFTLGPSQAWNDVANTLAAL